VVGGSMGAQQTYEWAVRFPDKVLRAAPIAGTAKNTPHDFLFTETLNEQIWSDPGWYAGEYVSNEEVVEGLKRHAHLWGTMGFSTEFWKQEKWSALGFASKEEFLTGFLEPYFTAMDPNNLLTMAWKWQRGDVSRHTGGDLAAALGRITTRTCSSPSATARSSRCSSPAASCVSSMTSTATWVCSPSTPTTSLRSTGISPTSSPPWSRTRHANPRCPPPPDP